MDIYLTASQFGKYSRLATSTSVNNCYLIYNQLQKRLETLKLYKLIQVEPPCATISRKRPPPISNRQSKTPKLLKSNHSTAGTSRKRPPLIIIIIIIIIIITPSATGLDGTFLKILKIYFQTKRFIIAVLRPLESSEAIISGFASLRECTIISDRDQCF